MLVAAAICGCGGDKGKQPAGPSASAEATAGSSTSKQEEPVAEIATGAAAEPEPAIPTEGDPDDHFLGHGGLFAATKAYEQGYVYADPVAEVEPPGDTGMGLFKVLSSGKEILTEHFWNTRRAEAADLAVGVIALMLDRKDAQGIYVAPATVDQAYKTRWWMARITCVKPLQASGYVWVAGGHKVTPDAIRVLEGDDSPRIALAGDEDAHFVRSDHWVVGSGPLKDTGYTYVSIAAAARPFEGGEGRFVEIYNGRIVDTAHAWRTVKAGKKKVKKGKHVLVPDLKEGNAYRAPETRKEALFTRWWFAKVLKKKGKVAIVEGDYEVAIDALRSVKK
jgi:hypothetical protein